MKMTKNVQTRLTQAFEEIISNEYKSLALNLQAYERIADKKFSMKAPGSKMTKKEELALKQQRLEELKRSMSELKSSIKVMERVAKKIAAGDDVFPAGK